MKKFLLNVLAIVSVFLVCGNLTAWGFDIVHHKPSPAPGTNYEVVYTTLANFSARLSVVSTGGRAITQFPRYCRAGKFGNNSNSNS